MENDGFIPRHPSDKYSVQETVAAKFKPEVGIRPQ